MKKLNNGNNQLVVDFIMSQVNPFYLGAYNTLASLKYPIPDYLSLVQQLEQSPESAKKEEKKPLAGGTQQTGRIIHLVLGPRNFPISTPQSALEKFYEGLLSLLELREPIPNPRDELEVPEDKPRTPHPDDVKDACRQARDRALQTFMTNNPNASADEIGIIGIMVYLECMNKWAHISLPFSIQKPYSLNI